MPNSSFSDLIIGSALKSWGGFISFFGLVSVLFGFFYIPETETITVRWLIIFGSFFIYLVMVFARSAWTAHEKSHFPKFRVIHAKLPPPRYETATALIIIEPTPILAHDAVLSFYYTDNGVESFMGIGKVINVQEDGKVQILLGKIFENQDKLEMIKGNNKDELKKIIIKPIIPSFIVEE